MTIPVVIGIAVTLLILVALSAIFSAAETAYAFTPQAKIEAAVRSGKVAGKLIRKHYKKFGWTLATILISNNLVNIGASALATYLFTYATGETGNGALISTLVVTPVIVIFGELVPKFIAKKHPYSYLKIVVFIIEGLNWVFFPFTFPLSKLVLSSEITNSELDLKHLIRIAKREKVLETQEADLVQRALDLDSTPISRLMTPHKEIKALTYGITISKAKVIFADSAHSRMPVRDSKGDYIGAIILKDIVFEDENKMIDQHIKKITFLSQNMIASKALESMRKNRMHLALVTKSTKTKIVSGLITLEDIIEYLVGEIYDEHDEEKAIHEIAHKKWVARGSTSLRTISQAIGVVITDSNEEGKKDISLLAWLEKRVRHDVKLNTRYIYQKRVAFKVVSKTKNEELLVEITLR